MNKPKSKEKKPMSVATLENDETIVELQESAVDSSENGVKSEGKKLSPKAKQSLGLSADRVLCWVPIDSSKEESVIIGRAAKVRNQDKALMLRDLFHEYLQEIMPQIEADAARYEPKVKVGDGTRKRRRVEDMTPDEAEQEIAKVEKKAAALEAMKAKIQAKIDAAKNK